MSKLELMKDDVRFLQNVMYYDRVLFVDEGHHMDAMFEFIYLKLLRTVKHWEEEAPSEVPGWEEELIKIKSAAHHAEQIVLTLENGGQPSDVNVVMLFTALMDAHKWWGTW